jgi:hypothetical protein
MKTRPSKLTKSTKSKLNSKKNLNPQTGKTPVSEDGNGFKKL